MAAKVKVEDLKFYVDIRICKGGKIAFVQDIRKSKLPRFVHRDGKRIQIDNYLVTLDYGLGWDITREFDSDRMVEVIDDGTRQEGTLHETK